MQTGNNQIKQGKRKLVITLTIEKKLFLKKLFLSFFLSGQKEQNKIQLF